MRGMPVFFGGLVLSAGGDSRVTGGCMNMACDSGYVFVFDKPAQGWEDLQVRGNPYPRGRAGHTMTGDIICIFFSDITFIELFIVLLTAV